MGLATIPTQNQCGVQMITLKATSSTSLSGTSYLIGNSAIGSFSGNVLTVLLVWSTTITATNPGST